MACVGVGWCGTLARARNGARDPVKRWPARLHLRFERSLPGADNVVAMSLTELPQRPSRIPSSRSDAGLGAGVAHSPSPPRRTPSKTSFQELQRVFNEAHSGVPTRTGNATMSLSFEATVDCTKWGDTVALVGSLTELGSWRPDVGIRMTTDVSSFPVWKARLPPLACPPGSRLEYKLVILRACGTIEWEELPSNRHLELHRGRDLRLRVRWSVAEATETAIEAAVAVSSPIVACTPPTTSLLLASAAPSGAAQDFSRLAPGGSAGFVPLQPVPPT